uniref:Uncharacterized protein n=1 Tax=Oryza sativa subsp. japonica TaxID=39947 RepID=Q5Z6N4_ORYSJ|nr:hypothetical protein [Oryza sativa Japonica Group]BAD54385.1 hypothetical protein [Oryza sativa Japonica Group]
MQRIWRRKGERRRGEIEIKEEDDDEEAARLDSAKNREEGREKFYKVSNRHLPIENWNITEGGLKSEINYKAIYNATCGAQFTITEYVLPADLGT